MSKGQRTKDKGQKTVAFLVNGTPMSALSVRAQAFAAHLSGQYDVRLLYRSEHKISSLLRFFFHLLRIKPQLSCVFDMGYSGVLAAALYKILARNQLIIETGDVIYELARSLGTRNWFGLWLTKRLEELSFKVADRIVVRGTRHKEWLSAHGVHHVDVIQDGVESEKFKPLDATDLRRQYHLDGLLTVGFVGTSIWNERWDMGYGWELVETLRLLKHEPVKGIIIGDGSGIPKLKARCREYGIENKVLFLGHVPYDQLPAHLNLIDVCLSTQTNDLVGQVRTTGKLPLYLAAGRYILASKVGEAALVLDDEMLVEYEGVKDLQYPQKLAEKITTLLNHPEMLKRSLRNVAVAKERFDYSILADRIANLIKTTLGV
jgi:glycosyltransferase involved in cell wall biosynthesis